MVSSPAMAFDIAFARRQTPGCASVAHLNNAGAALQTATTFDVVTSHLKLEAAFGGYEAAVMAASGLENVRTSAARLLNAAPSEVALMTSDSHAFMKAFWGLVVAGWFNKGDVIVVDRLSYTSHQLAFLQARRMLQLRIEVCDDLLDIPSDARLVAYTLIGTHSGKVHDVSGVSDRTRSLGIPFFLDGCQAVGQRVVDVESLGCDVLTATGRKWLRGPRGTGLLYVRHQWIAQMEPPGIDGGGALWSDTDSYELASDARRFEEFETSFACRLGLGAAIDQALDTGIPAIAARVSDLAEELRAGLQGKQGVTLQDGDDDRCGIVTFTVDGVDPVDIQRAAAAKGVNVSVSSAPFARLDMDRRGLAQLVRASPHAYNSQDELGQLLDVISAS